MGMNRSTLRVAAYGFLMTDRYSPFPLGMGGAEPVVHAEVGGQGRWCPCDGTLGTAAVVLANSILRTQPNR